MRAPWLRAGMADSPVPRDVGREVGMVATNVLHRIPRPHVICIVGIMMRVDFPSPVVPC